DGVGAHLAVGLEVRERGRPGRARPGDHPGHERRGVDAGVDARGRELFVEVHPRRDIVNRMKIVAGAVAMVALAAAAPLSSATRALAPCTGSMLTGTFKAVPNSPGAGNIVYQLRVTTTGASPCFVTGVPRLTLLNLHGQKLPTNAAFAGYGGELTAVVVPL